MEELAQQVESLEVPLPPAPVPVHLSPTSPVENTTPPRVSPVSVPVLAPQPKQQPKQQATAPQEIKFAPVTKDGMAAFFAAMRRPSTGQLSVASSKENLMESQVAATEKDGSENSVMEVQSQEPPGPPVLPDNQLGDSSIFPPPDSLPEKDQVMEESQEVASGGVNTQPSEQSLTPSAAETPVQPVVPAVVPPVAPPVAPTLPPQPSAVVPPQPSAVVPPQPPAVVPATPLNPDRAGEPAPTPELEQPEDKKAKKAQYMRFSRNVRGPNCPPPVRKKFMEAMADQDPVSSAKKIQDLFQEFRKCQEDWSRSEIVLEERRTSTTANRGIWKWMTKDES